MTIMMTVTTSERDALPPLLSAAGDELLPPSDTARADADAAAVQEGMLPASAADEPPLAMGASDATASSAAMDPSSAAKKVLLMKGRDSAWARQAAHMNKLKSHVCRPALATCNGTCTGKGQNNGHDRCGFGSAGQYRNAMTQAKQL